MRPIKVRQKTVLSFYKKELIYGIKCEKVITYCFNDTVSDISIITPFIVYM